MDDLLDALVEEVKRGDAGVLDSASEALWGGYSTVDGFSAALRGESREQSQVQN